MQAILAHFTKSTKQKSGDTTSPDQWDDDINETTDETTEKIPEEEELEQAAAANEAETNEATPSGQVIHDTAVVKNLKGRAILQMAAKGICVTLAEQKMAEGIIPKVYSSITGNRMYSNFMFQVSGLARRVNDSTSILRPEFERLVASTPDLLTDKTTLSRRVATRWNSEFACVDDHLLLRKPVEQLTGQSNLKLSSYRLSQNQWPLTKELRNLLKVSSIFHCLFYLILTLHIIIIVQDFP